MRPRPFGIQPDAKIRLTLAVPHYGRSMRYATDLPSRVESRQTAQDSAALTRVERLFLDDEDLTYESKRSYEM